MFKTRMYLSGSLKGEAIDNHILSTGAYRLFTFAYAKEGIDFLDYADSIGVRAKLMIDSGAFSAWNSGRDFQVEQLIEYDKKLIETYGERHDFVFIGLDVIPGERNRAPVEGEIRAAMDKSYDNFITMQQEINRPVLPVFHSGEGSWLRDKYLAKTDYICLSMNQTLSEKDRVAWARQAHLPGVKMHGLAATGNRMLTQVDWYSVDSSGWLMVAGMGSLLFPTGDGKGLRTLAISAESPARYTANAHYDNLHNQTPVRELIESMGYNIEQLRTEYRMRMHWNIQMWSNPPWKKEIVDSGLLFDLL